MDNEPEGQHRVWRRRRPGLPTARARLLPRLSPRFLSFDAPQLPWHGCSPRNGAACSCATLLLRLVRTPDWRRGLALLPLHCSSLARSECLFPAGPSAGSLLVFPHLRIIQLIIIPPEEASGRLQRWPYQPLLGKQAEGGSEEGRTNTEHCDQTLPSSKDKVHRPYRHWPSTP